MERKYSAALHRKGDQAARFKLGQGLAEAAPFLLLGISGIVVHE